MTSIIQCRARPRMALTIDGSRPRCIYRGGNRSATRAATTPGFLGKSISMSTTTEPRTACEPEGDRSVPRGFGSWKAILVEDFGCDRRGIRLAGRVPGRPRRVRRFHPGAG